MKNKKGFTLVELLVVIAIIGILSSVAVVNLNSARTKAREAAAKGNVTALAPAVTLCFDEGADLAQPTSDTTGGGVICTGHAEFGTWPPATQGYVWDNIASSYANGTYYIGASSTADTDFYCTQGGCQEGS